MANTAKNQSQVTTLDNNPTPTTDAPADAKPAVAEVKGANHDDQMSGERRLITIHPTEGEGGADAVFVGHNGYAYQIPRGTPQLVPVEVIEIIRNAKTTTYQSGKDGVTERTVQRYAYTLE